MKKFLFSVALFSLMVVAPITSMLFDDHPPYSWDEGYVYPDPAPDGAQINVCWHLRVFRVCPGVIQRQLIDSHGEIHNYDPVLAARAEDVKTPFCVTFKLPLGMPKGLTKYRVHAAYSCNPLQVYYPIKVTTPELSFVQE